jgi:hypothetical protein
MPPTFAEPIALLSRSHRKEATASRKQATQENNNMKKLYLNAAIGALISGLVAMPAMALDVNVGSSGNGGTSAGASQGGTSANATVGGGNNLGSVTVGTGGNDASVDIGTGSGPTISATQGGSILDDDSNTDADVNLGVLQGLIGGGGGGAVDEGAVETAFGSMSGAKQQQLKVTCYQVMSTPTRFDGGMVDLCRLLLTL